MSRMKNIFIYITSLLLICFASHLQGQCSLSCLDEIQVSVDENCEALITIDMVLQDASATCVYSITLEELNGVNISNPVQDDYLERTIRANVYSGGNTCSTLINIEDKLGPLIVCPSDTILACYEDFMIGFDDVTVDNCDMSFELVIDADEIMDTVCGDFFSATRVITFHAEDEMGNESAICTQLISYTRPDLANLTFPRDYDDILVSTPSLKCDEAEIWDLNDNFYPDPEETGSPMIDDFPMLPNINKFCEINVNYEDDTIPLCGSAFKVLRTWTVLDWCQPTSPGVNPVIDIQIIKIIDNRGPEVECPDPFDAYTNHHKCSSAVIAPHPTVLDDCSGVRYEVQYRKADAAGFPNGLLQSHNITYVEEESDSFYIINDLPLGRSWIYYNVFDDCGNVTVCSTYVEVIDDDVPTAVCDQHTVISLGSDGTARAYAHTFDDGSKDNCEIVLYEVRRREENDCSDILYGPSVDFCCSDAGNYVGVELRVTDESGNSNTCKVQIRVDDKQRPVINCVDIVIDCTIDYHDPLNTGGEPEVHDNCDVTLSFMDQPLQASDCGTGTFYRYWTAVDQQGLTDQCTQHITIDVFDPFDGVIDWPDDYYVESCTIDGIDPEWAGYPEYSTESCSFIAASYDDKIYNFHGGHCYEIWRKWKVIDWCQFDRDDPYQTGIWWYTQKLYIDDPVKPTINSSCHDVTVDSKASDCVEPVLLFLDAEDNCTDSALLRIDYRIDTDLNGTYEIYGVGNNKVEDLPLGINRIYWTVSDNCGNVSKCDYLIRVVDAKPPTPYCLGGINTVLMESTGQITIWASDLNLGSFDNCNDSLRFSFSSDPDDWYKQYNCDELGMDTIQIWVTDLSGNQDYCRTMVDIQSNGEVCDTSEIVVNTPNLSGTIANVDGLPIEDTEVHLRASDYTNMEITGSAGSYAFTDLVSGKDYMVSAFKNDDIKKGVSTLDLVLIQKHILGIQKLTSPYDLIAADINHSNSLTASDLISLRKVILNLSDQFPNNTSWRFLDPNEQFVDPSSPWYFSEEFMLPDMITSHKTDLMGVKVGDVNNSIQLSTSINVANRSASKLMSISLDEENIEINLEEGMDLSGFQFSLNYPNDEMEVVSVSSSQLNLQDNEYTISEDVISFSYTNAYGISILDSKPMIQIQYRAKTKRKLTHSDFFLNTDVLEAEIYNSSLEIYSINLNEKRSLTDYELGFSISQNNPNPFSNGTNIDFYIPETGEVKINILQIDGQSIFKQDQLFEKGRHNIELSADLFRNNGVFLYYIEYGGERFTNKMIKI